MKRTLLITNTDSGDRRQGRQSPRREPGCGSRVTDRDRELLGFIALHPFVLAQHVRAWMGVGSSVCYRKLASLLTAGLLSYKRIFHLQPGCYLITSRGLAIAESDLPVPRIDLRTYTHDAGLVWLSLAAIEGRFGALGRLLAEREMRSHDQRDLADRERYGFKLLGVDRHGRPRTHYPDLLLIRDDGQRVAFELELTLKSRPRLRAILAGYGSRRGLEAVMYFTSNAAVANAVLDTAASLGLEELVRVRPVNPPSPQPDQSRGWRQASFALREVDS